MKSFFRIHLHVLIASFFVVISILSPARAAERERIEAFLGTTGFDVALDSIAFASASAPEMLGLERGAFGADWERVADTVFDKQTMRRIALDILEQTLSDEALNHAVEFYASDLGQRLVEAENASHMIEDDTEKQAQGRALIADMVQQGRRASKSSTG